MGKTKKLDDVKLPDRKSTRRTSVVKEFEDKTGKKALWGGKETKPFKRWQVKRKRKKSRIGDTTKSMNRLERAAQRRKEGGLSAQYQERKDKQAQLAKKYKKEGKKASDQPLYKSNKSAMGIIGKRLKAQNETKKKGKKLNVVEAHVINGKRSQRARDMDKKTLSKKIATDQRWKDEPGKYDYPGVDTPRKRKVK